MSQRILVISILLIVAASVSHAKGRGDPDLVKSIDALLDQKAIRGAKASILLEHLPSGRTLFAKNPGLRLHPASNTKLITTAVALRTLGPRYRWYTDIAVDSIRNGVASNLYFIGRGDPYFVSESLWKLIDDARFAGLRKISGDIIIDASRFTDRRLAPGFADKNQDSAYRAASGAASLNFNSVSIRVGPSSKSGDKPKIELRPPSGHIKVINRAMTTKRGRERLGLKASQFEDRTQVKLTGRIPRRHGGLIVRRRIDNPAQYLGDALRHYLVERGVVVEGSVKIGAAPPKRRRLARLYSRPLREIIATVNKTSNNFMAEQLVLTMGVEKGDGGNWAAGTDVVSQFLKENWKLSGFNYVNGSGLFGKTSFSAQDFITILRGMNTLSPPIFEYVDSLAVSRVDGTLRRRLKGLNPGRVRAKTGTLDGVICLSGYLWFADGSPGAFSLLMNDFKGAPWAVWKAHDKIVQTMANYNPKGGKGTKRTK